MWLPGLCFRTVHLQMTAEPNRRENETGFLEQEDSCPSKARERTRNSMGFMGGMGRFVGKVSQAVDHLAGQQADGGFVRALEPFHDTRVAHRMAERLVVGEDDHGQLARREE